MGYMVPTQHASGPASNPSPLIYSCATVRYSDTSPGYNNVGMNDAYTTYSGMSKNETLYIVVDRYISLCGYMGISLMGYMNYKYLLIIPSQSIEYSVYMQGLGQSSNV